MIDELVKAANAMGHAGISAKDWHPKLKPLRKVTAKAPCIRIWLTNDGHIHDLEPLSVELASQLRKFEPDNGKSFPGFNVRPLFIQTLIDSEAKKASKELEVKIRSTVIDWKEVLSLADDLWEKDTSATINRILSHVSESLKKVCLRGGGLGSDETLMRLFNTAEKMNSGQFQEEYCEKVKEKIGDGSLPLSLLIFWGKEGKESNFSVFLDIKDYKEYPVAHPKTIERLNTLMSTVGSEAASDFGGGCNDAYGLDNASLNEKFPEVALPALGGVKLRSQVKEVPAQSRYDFCEAATFHVGSESRKRTKRALEWLANKEREGETYGVAGDKELLFAYPHVLPDKKIPLAQLFGVQRQDDSYQQEDSFERLASSVIEQLKGSGTEVAKTELEIFALRKMDKARTKVVYYRNVTVASLEQESAAWHAGCRNIPGLAARDWSKDKNGKTGKSYLVPVEGQTVSPVKLCRYLNAIWKHDGQRADTSKSRVKTFTPTDGLRLLLDKPNSALASHMLSHFIRHAQGYFLTLCRGVGKNEVTSLPDKEYYLGILGLLLFNLGSKKEDFMKESAFLLGRCLRITDEIHRLYCEIVRKKELPPQLCGSSLLVGMMESPSTTLSQLAMRSAPYVKWAKVCRDDEKGSLVHYWLKQWSTIADQLHTMEWPKRLTPEERAQIFLGYLASFSKSEKQTTSVQIDSDNNINHGEDK